MNQDPASDPAPFPVHPAPEIVIVVPEIGGRMQQNPARQSRAEAQERKGFAGPTGMQAADCNGHNAGRISIGPNRLEPQPEPVHHQLKGSRAPSSTCRRA